MNNQTFNAVKEQTLKTHNLKHILESMGIDYVSFDFKKEVVENE